MAEIVNSGQLIKASYTSLATIPGNVLIAKPWSTSLVVFCFATTAGSLQLLYLDADGVARNFGAATPVVANTLLVLPFAHHVPRLRADFTPSAQPGTATVEVYSAGGVR